MRAKVEVQSFSFAFSTVQRPYQATENYTILRKWQANLVLMTSAGVVSEAAGMPPIAPATRTLSGELYPFSSANIFLACAYTGK